MELILKHDVENLGFKDDIVSVKNGYGRNFLIPEGQAILATISAKKVLAENAPALVVILTGIAVNLRMAMYSASIAPHIGKSVTWQRILIAYFLVDQSYAVSVLKYENEPELNLSQKVAYFFGSMTPIAPIWYISTYVGIIAGSAIPQEYALDFAIPITFLA